MIISRTPFRISFFGGGTDYPTWFREHGGTVLSTTIDKYCYISVRKLPPFFEHKHRIVYSKIESVQDIKDISHPSVRAVLKYLFVNDGIEIHHDGDVPAKSGLGSSSSFTVGLLNAIHALNGHYTSKKELAAQSIYIEQKILEETVGSQDQVAVAYGGLNRIDFKKDESFNVSPVILVPERKAELQNHLVLFFTGLSRFATEIARTKVDNFGSREQELKAMGAMVEESLSILQSTTAPIAQFGELLHESWQLKRSLSTSVSNPEIDNIYEEGRRAGAIGGKLLGAGGGGFILFFTKPENRKALIERLNKYLHVSFKFEGDGSKIALYDPQL